MSNKRTIFITGSSSGLGKATAKLFAERGWNVIASMRNPAKGVELSDVAGVIKYPLDVTKPEDVSAAAEKFGPTVDVVLNNAGCEAMVCIATRAG